MAYTAVATLSEKGQDQTMKGTEFYEHHTASNATTHQHLPTRTNTQHATPQHRHLLTLTRHTPYPYHTRNHVNPSKLRFNTAAQNAAFAPPLGLGAILFKPNVKIVKSEGDDERTGKIGGAKNLASSQAASLERQQVAEFKKRYRSRPVLGRLPGQYAGQSSDSRAELVLCLDTKGGRIIGCAGVEGQ
eukprot:scaffold80353_cov24-Cyclotella_meneghiniana.AAC.1